MTGIKVEIRAGVMTVTLPMSELAAAAVRKPTQAQYKLASDCVRAGMQSGGICLACGHAEAGMALRAQAQHCMVCGKNAAFGFTAVIEIGL